VHDRVASRVHRAAIAAEFGLQVGNTYPLAVFHAERHTDQSHFKMVTSIDCFLIE
jgi:fibro-slime domain-containing protein